MIHALRHGRSPSIVILATAVIVVGLSSCASAPKPEPKSGVARETSPSMIADYSIKRRKSSDLLLEPIAINRGFTLILESTANGRLWFYGITVKPGGLADRMELGLSVDPRRTMMRHRSVQLPLEHPVGDYRTNRANPRAILLRDPQLIIGYGFGRELPEERDTPVPFYNLSYDPEILKRFDESVLIYLDVEPAES
ncbi:hypothetical protein [Salinispira pacifica]